MRSIEEIRTDINECDSEIAAVLTRRMDCIREIIEYKRKNGVPIFQPQQEKHQQELLRNSFVGMNYEEEMEEVFRTITTMSKQVQTKELLPYNIALVGFMGCGKSTVSAFLKDMLAMDVVETDRMIVDEAGMSINDIFARFGEPYFRNLESNACIEMEKRTRTIISCGGGLVMRQENVDSLRKHARIVLLTAKPETILARVADSDERPILNGHKNVEYISQLMEKRRANYEAAADLILPTDDRSVVEICEELIRRIH